MKFINFLLALSLVCSGCATTCDVSKIVPEFKLIKRFSAKLEENGLTLYGYGINNRLPKDYCGNNIVANISVSYRQKKTQKDVISLEDARCLLVSIAESFLAEVNNDPEIKDRLDVYPLTSDLLRITIYFEDENKVPLGNGGIAEVYFAKGEIIYDGYQIEDYKPKYPIGKDYLIHKEPYTEALDLVKKQGCLALIK